jgi:uncharacterized protein (UPF0332 family)
MALEPRDLEKPLVYLSRLSKAERRAVLDVGRALPGAALNERMRQAEVDVTLDRLILSEGLLMEARELAAKGTEQAFRAAVNRGYYAVHHAVRAVILHETHREADGHAAAIEDLKKLLRGQPFRARAGLHEGTLLEVAQARDNRSVADYSPYAFSRREGTARWISITGNHWSEAAKFNIELAERLHRAAARLVGLA